MSVNILLHWVILLIIILILYYTQISLLTLGKISGGRS